ncbi:MAG: SpoIIE family protein phosphatase, partial [Bacteroidales bacterium]|nr:SpoIIE family protein phosphatase [Bacteroidales bacterium]
MELQIAVAKTNKNNSLDGGDTIEFIERPNGGFSVVMADAHATGKMAKVISSMVVRKTISLLAEGIRDSAAAKGASDYLYTERNGDFPAYLNILSVDLLTNTLVITRNNPLPILISHGERIEFLSGESLPIGVSRDISPVISEMPLKAGMTTIMYTSGIQTSGNRYGLDLDICTLVESILEEQNPLATEIADTLLAEAIR